MKRIIVGIIILSLIVIVGCAKIPTKIPIFEYNLKTQDDPCPENKKMSYQFNGAEFVETGCKDIAPDAGKICKNDDECTNDCFVTREYLDEFGCESDLCSGQKECRGIQGRCEAIIGEAQVTLPNTNTLEYFCDL